MASGRLDLFIAKLPLHTVVLTLNCSEKASDLLSIPRNTKLTLKRGGIKQQIQLQFLEGRECFADFMEMNYALARRFRLTALRRYTLDYNPNDQSLTINPAPLSETVALIASGPIAAGSLSVGYELLSRLGIPERQGSIIKVRSGKHLVKLHLHVPANLSDDRLRLSSQWLQRWKLAPNQNHMLQFDQRTFTLSIASASSIGR
ncbi:MULTISPECIES: hypothetical protein [Cohnella]|uniref:Uncharacterized protein n=1 Tax=Cohnella phaseoli TaxID=456490 RepID=A0A3D9KLQ2_9BACL|nr:hypothetical protein [Cohnella phaseoli]RED86483.1 hypothetical protein DFP98_103338 [Cohnella phaseoli]